MAKAMPAGVLSCVRIQAPAKINLTLRVLGTHADGYHELRTMFQSVALHDTLTFRTAPGPFVIDCTDPSCPVDASNLVWRAADLLWRAAKRRRTLSRVRVELRKRIPQQAGLGGGSSDAAATVLALSVLWNLSLPEPRLRDIARELGADVGFFFEGGTVLGVDRGDVLYPLLDRQDQSVVLVLPDFGVSTRDAYGWWDQAHAAETAKAPAHAVPSEWINDLQGPVAAHHPVIGTWVNRMRQSGATYAAMSGSGSALFGLFETRDGADQAARKLAGPGRRILTTHTLSRRAYRRFTRVQRLG
jgi:4-diphosphocytidyl-2-C-methyl-D-erythritol kinase